MYINILHRVGCKCAYDSDNKFLKKATVWFVDNDAGNFRDAGLHQNVRSLLIDQPLQLWKIQGMTKYFYENVVSIDRNPAFLFVDFDETVNMMPGVHVGDSNLEPVFGDYNRQYSLAQLFNTLLNYDRVYVVTNNPAIQHVTMLLNKLIQLEIGSKNSHKFIEHVNVVYTMGNTKLNFIQQILASIGYIAER